MVLRGLLRDLLSLYLGYRVLQTWFFGASGQAALPFDIALVALILFALAIWFILERVGIIPKLGE